MDHAIGFSGGLLACGAAALAAAMATRWLHRLAERRGNRRAPQLRRGVLAMLIGVLPGEGLPLLWPALAPWRPAVLGACIGLAYGAMRNGGSMRVDYGHAAPSMEEQA